MDNQNYEKQLHIIMKIIKPDNMMSNPNYIISQYSLVIFKGEKNEKKKHYQGGRLTLRDLKKS